MPIIMDADRMSRTLTRIAHEIVERNRGPERLGLVGVAAACPAAPPRGDGPHPPAAAAGVK